MACRAIFVIFALGGCVIGLSLAAPVLPQPPSAPGLSSAERPGIPRQTSSAKGKAAIFVTVTDEKGQPVPDLREEEIQVFEDGRKQQIESFARDSATAVLAGILVDISGSRRDEKTRTAELNALSRFLHTSLRVQDGAYIAAFGDQMFLLTDLTNNTVDFDRALHQIALNQPRGSTSLFDSIHRMAGTQFPGRWGRRVLLVLSDFQDNASRHTIEETIQKAQETDAAIYCLVDGMSPEAQSSKRASKKGLQAAEEIATQTGGRVLVFDSADALAPALEQVKSDWQNFYLIRYGSAKGVHDGRRHKLKIVLTRKEASVMSPSARYFSKD